MQPTFMLDSGRVEYLASRGRQTPARRRQSARRRAPAPTMTASQTLFEALESATFSFPAAPGLADAQNALCQRPTLHDEHNLFFSDYRMVSRAVPVFSTAKIDGFGDVLIPMRTSRNCKTLGARN